MNTLTREEMILYFEDVHLGRYVYDSLFYVNNKTKIKIRCRVHGIFEQSAYYHSKGHGCAQCNHDGRLEKQDVVFNQFREVHGDRYDYSKSVYNGMAEKITIRCRKHGTFEQKAQNHLNGSGCKQCYLEEKEQERLERKQKLFSWFKLLFNGRYTYKEDEYQREDVKIRVYCTLHGYFEVTPRLHKSGSCCPTCKEDKSFKQIIKQNLDSLKNHNLSIS